ncbi:MAG: aminotransferase class V-fold PLP-dependent enzyme [Patescibacteria group bacterium]
MLVSITEHHANIVPWFLAQKNAGIEIEFVNVTEDYQIDMDDFRKKYDEKVKVVSLTRVSNVSGGVFDLKKVSESLRPDTIFVVDASQAIPNFDINVADLECDFLIFT